MKAPLYCPVDGVKIDENKVRIGAGIIVAVAAAYLLTENYWLAVFLLIDFSLRAFNLFSYSPVSRLSGLIAKFLKLNPKSTNRAPKRFAAFIGAFFSALTLAAVLAGFSFPARILMSVLMIFACLESFAGFCAGCCVYTLLRRVKKVN